MKNRAKPSKPKQKYFVFRGFIRCGECGCMITAEVQKSHHYYRCTKKRGKCTQRYVREEILAEQISNHLREVSIGEEVGNWMLVELDKEKDQEEKTNTQTIQILKERLRGIDEKLDRLLDGYISGLLTPEEYLAKKESIINQRIETKEKLESLNRKSTDWLELTRDFVNACNNAGKSIEEENLAAQRDFLKEAGLNFFLKDRVLSFSWSKPFSFIAEANQQVNSLPSLSPYKFKDSQTLPSSVLLQGRAEMGICSGGSKGLATSSKGADSDLWSIWRRGRDSNPR